MAEFNSEMYLQQRTPDILGGIQSGMKIGEMKRQRKSADTAEMFKKGLREAATTDEKGNVTYDQKRLSERYVPSRSCRDAEAEQRNCS